MVKKPGLDAHKRTRVITPSLSVETGFRLAQPDILEWIMQRFYFDLFDGSDISRDEVGTTFDDHKQAQNAAAESLLEIMRSRRAKGDAAELMFLVRDASNMAAFAVRLSLQVTSEGMLFGSASEKLPVPSLCP